MTLTSQHPWDTIRERQTVISTAFIKDNLYGFGSGIHESLLRSYHVLEEVKAMLERGDSPETVLEFITWVAAPRG